MKTKQQLIQEYLEEPLKVGDVIYVQGLGSQDKNSWFYSTSVVDIIDGEPYIKTISGKIKVTENWKSFDETARLSISFSRSNCR